MSLQLKSFAPGMVAANSYIIKDLESGEAAIIDSGVYNNRFESIIQSMGIEKLKYILLTHGHFDHIMGVQRLKKHFGGEIVIHEMDAVCLSDSKKSLAAGWGFMCPAFEADKTVKDGDILYLGGEKIEVIHTPGHTVGSVCYKTDKILFSGDTLFHMTCGRTDFPGGSMDEMMNSMKKLCAIEGEHRVCPGHNGETTLSFEKSNNPYMKGI
ncbi:MAG: MBL fold metallo-hydrolase [Clostridia bacterium]|nr:MBL fold metallo-hydrolase [Clostridia bacterium]